MNTHLDPTGMHAVYAPSSAHRWMTCTASATGIAALGDQEEGEEAAEGTRAHDEIERILGQFNGQIADPEAIREAASRLADRHHPAAYGIALTLSYLAKLPRGRVWIEQRVQLTPQIWGRCDIAHWHEESSTVTIVDYKNGFVDVQAEENEQLQIYAAGSIYTHNLPAKWARLAVVQPNSFMPVPRVKQWTVNAEDLFAFATRAAAVPTGPLEFRAGEQCKYCPLFGRCPASQDVLVRLGVAMANAPADVPPDQVALFKAMEKPIKDWMAGLDKAATKRVLSGAVVPGMKLVQTLKHRAWKDEQAARAEIVAALGTDALKLPTPAQAEEQGMPADAVAKLADRPDGGPALAFESDKRPTFVRKSAAEMFSGVVKS